METLAETGGEAVIKTLEQAGVRFAYGIPAVHNLPIYDALYSSKTIMNLPVRHEQSAGYMAIGSAYVSGETAVCVVGSGPGATNMVTPVCEAYLDSTPMLVVAGGVSLSKVGKGALHEVPHLAIFDSITKRCERVSTRAGLEGSLNRALTACRSGRPRPVFVEVPFDVLISTSSPSSRPAKPRGAAKSRIRRVDKSLLAKVAKALVEARRPMIIAGGGVNASESWTELSDLAEILQAPVASTISAKGAYPESLPLSIGQLWDEVSLTAIGESDLVLSLGCRFSERSTAAWSFKIKKLIQVDIDPTELGRNYPATIGIASDLRSFLTGLLEERLTGGRGDADRVRRIEELQRAKIERARRYSDSASSTDVPMKPQRVVSELREALPDDVVLVSETGYGFWWPITMLKIDRPRSFLSPAGNSTLGFGFPAALGAKLARPDLPVIALVGDGGFLFTCQELAIAVENKINVVTVVFDDRGYAAIREYQRRGYGSRFTGVDFATGTDFGKLAEAFGADGVTVEKPSEVRQEVREALKRSRPTVIDVRVTRDEDVVPKFFTKAYGSR